MAQLRIELPAPHAGQRQVIDDAKRFNVVCCGRRWGKSTLGIDRIIGKALQGGEPCAWFAPTYKHLLDVWRELTGVLQPVMRDKSESERRLQIAGGGVIECWSMDSAGDSARGRKYALVVVDEAALVPQLEQAWQGTLRPMLADLRGGAWFLSTPRGMNDFKAFFDRGQDPEREDWASWQMPTASNPFIAIEEVEAARLDMSEASFAQEFLATFVSWEGSVFRRIRDAIVEPPPDMPAAVVGVDWGRTNDFTVFLALSARGETLGIERFRGLEYSLQRGRLHAFWERLGRPWIVAETNNMGGPVVEQLQRDGLPVVPFVTTNPSKAAAVEALALGFERDLVKIPNDPVLIAELQAFEARTLPSGLTRYSAPEGMHDDMVMALMLAWTGLGALQQQSEQRTVYLDWRTGRLIDDPPERYQISPI